MNKLKALAGGLLICTFIVAPSSGVVINGSDYATANKTAPTDTFDVVLTTYESTLPYWNAVGKYNDATMIYIGNRYALTANHVTGSSVIFNEGTAQEQTIAVTKTQQVGGEDIKLLRLASDPTGVTPVTLNAIPNSHSYSSGDTLYAVGNGRQRDNTNQQWYYNSTTKQWANSAGSGYSYIGDGYNAPSVQPSELEKRWGTNNFSGNVSGTTQKVFTYNMSGGGDECALTYGDSGGAVFYCDWSVGLPPTAEWQLLGLMVGSGASGAPTGNKAIDGEYEYFYDLTQHKTDITDAIAAIPEPATLALLAGSAAALLARRKKR